MPLWPSSSKHRTCAPDMLFTQTIKSQNVAKPHSSGEETLWHNRRTCPDSGLHCGIGSHCLTDSCRKNEEEEEEDTRIIYSMPDNTEGAVAQQVERVPPGQEVVDSIPATAIAQTVECVTPGEEVLGLIPSVATCSLLVGSVSV